MSALVLINMILIELTERIGPSRFGPSDAEDRDA